MRLHLSRDRRSSARTRDGAKERGLDAVQAVTKFAGNGKALGEGDADGFVQLVAEKGTGRIVGCQIVGPARRRDSSTRSRRDARTASRSRSSRTRVYAHPTVSEVVKFACLDAAEAKV